MATCETNGHLRGPGEKCVMCGEPMPKPVRDVTAEYQRAESAADQMDMALQFGIPDLKKLLRSAYVLGYVDGARGAHQSNEVRSE